MSPDKNEPERQTRLAPNPLKLVAALEQAGDEAGLLALLEPDNSIVTRRAAAKALANVCRSDSASPITQHLAQEADRMVKISLISALGKLGSEVSLPILLETLKDREPLVRLETAKALSRFNSETAFESLQEALRRKEESYDRAIRQFAAEALGQLADRRAAPALTEALKDEEGLVRAAAARALGQLGDRSVIPALRLARHTIPHSRGTNCAECEAIDAALAALKE